MKAGIPSWVESAVSSGSPGLCNPPPPGASSRQDTLTPVARRTQPRPWIARLPLLSSLRKCHFLPEGLPDHFSLSVITNAQGGLLSVLSGRS